MGGHARPKWEAVQGRSGRPCEAKVGGRVRPCKAKFGLSDWLRQIT